MKREYLIELKVFNGIAYGEIDSWSGLVHDWNFKRKFGLIKVTATREELDLLLDKLYADETNYKVIGIHYSD